jgi:hypothetical protein
MEVVCNNSSCRFAKMQKVFSVDSISKGECPSCHGHSLLPSWAAQYQTIQDHTTRHELKKTTEKVKGNAQKILPKKKGSSSRSLDSIEFSYHEKLNKLSKAIRKNKAMQKFDSMDKDVVGSIVNAKEVEVELSTLQKLFGTFKKQSAKKKKDKITSKKSTPKKATKKIVKKPSLEPSKKPSSNNVETPNQESQSPQQPSQNENFFQ